MSILAYIVTIKLPRNTWHDPHNKITGQCVISDMCTDCTGEHHSYITTGDSIDAVVEEARKRYTYVTRVEEVFIR